MSTGQGVIGCNMFCYCGNNPVNRFDESGRFWKEIGDFFKNTFGVAVYASSKSEVDIIKTPLYGIETGEEANLLICGDPNKPIVFFCKNASSPFRFWEYHIGVQINISDNCGGALSIGGGELSFSTCMDDCAAEFNMGIATIGMTVYANTDYKTRSFSHFDKYYVNTINTFLLAGAIAFSGSFVSLSSPIPAVS